MQSNLAVLLFAVIAIIKLMDSVEATLLDVFLPVLLLIPAIYFLNISSLPGVSCYDVALLPLGIAAIASRYYNWRFQRADIWVIGYALAGFYTDYINLDLKTAFYNFIEPGFFGGLLAYAVGKLLIEQTGLREQFVRRLVFLLAAVGFFSIIEFVGKHNPFVVVTHNFFGHPAYWGDQYRMGFLRVKGPYLGAENAGIVFLMGLFLSLWLWKLNKSRPRPPEPRYLKVRRSTWCVGSIALGLAMTLSRGPALGGFVGYLIARVGMVKRWRLALALAIVVIGAGFYVAHRRAAALEAAAESPVVDETVASATYRTRLYDVYEPVAVAGGLFGWSGTLYSKVARELNPKAANFFSIDNEYLLLWVAQGKVGLGLFLLIVGEGLYALIRAIVRSKDPLDTCLFYCLGGMLIGLSVVLITVFLAGQGYILFFLISGWIQSIPDGKWTPKSSPTFAFRRVFT